MSAAVEIFTDGGCLGNPGPGAWAFVIRAGEKTLSKSGFESRTTNNRMELTAVREALSALASHPDWSTASVSLTTDSQYVQKGITQWIHAWIRNGWKTTAKKPVMNADLWAELWELSRSRPISWRWVMGHSGDHGNEMCHGMVEEEFKRHS